MTFREWAERYCTERGMKPEQAVAVVDVVATDPGMFLIEEVWSMDIERFAVGLRSVLAPQIDRHALAWIDANCPAAFYRSLFSGGAMEPAESP